MERRVLVYYGTNLYDAMMNAFFDGILDDENIRSMFFYREVNPAIDEIKSCYWPPIDGLSEVEQMLVVSKAELSNLADG